MNVRALPISITRDSKSLSSQNLCEITCLMAAFAAIGAVVGWGVFNLLRGFDNSGGLIAGLLFLAIALLLHPRGELRFCTLVRTAPIGTKLIGGIGTSMAAFGGYVIPEGIFLGDLDLITSALFQMSAFFALYAIRPKQAS